MGTKAPFVFCVGRPIDSFSPVTNKFQPLERDFPWHTTCSKIGVSLLLSFPFSLSVILVLVQLDEVVASLCLRIFLMGGLMFILSKDMVQ